MPTSKIVSKIISKIRTSAMYTPPFSITSEMLTLIDEITEKAGEIKLGKTLDGKPHLRKSNRIRSIHSSLRIEANSLSLSETRDVIEGKSVLGDKREIQEVKNAFRAYSEMETMDPYDTEELKRIHGIMTSSLLLDSGEYRKTGEGVFSGDKCIFIAPPPSMVHSLVNDLFSWMRANKESIHPLILSSVFHYEFVFIHPFSDGNGRMARLWHTVLLSRWKEIFSFLPLESQIEKYQDQYYEAISRSNDSGSSSPFILFMLQMIKKTLEEAALASRKMDMEVSIYVERMLENMEYGVPYSSKEILELLGLKSKETLRKNYIDPAISLGLINMTLPDTPRSKNQRYIRK